MQIIEVTTAALRHKFHALPHVIYRNDPAWIAPLKQDIEAVFDPEKNAACRDGESVRWVLLDDAGNVMGRVAAFINRPQVAKMEFPVGGFGFFECVNDKKAAFMLFDQCREWLEARGMKGMDGPVNFGERDRFWGLMVEGFTEPTYLENYNPPWYRQFFEEYGFRVYFEQITFCVQRDEFAKERLGKIVERISQKPENRFEHFNMSQLDRFVRDFVTIYNDAWSKFESFKPVKEADIRKTFIEMKAIIVPEFIWFAYVNNEPAGFIVMLPDVNQLFRYVNGNLNFWGKLKFLYYRRKIRMNRLKGLVFGVASRYQKMGLEAVLIYRFAEQILNGKQFETAEIAWVGSFNPQMQSLIKGINAEVFKKHITYRQLFDPGLPFRPYTLGEYGS